LVLVGVFVVHRSFPGLRGMKFRPGPQSAQAIIGEDVMNVRISAAGLVVLAVVFMGGWFGGSARRVAAASPAASIRTFSTADIGRQGHFYVGGHYVGEPGKETMDGAMYVEVWVPKSVRHPYPVVLMTGGGGQGAYALLQTPDGRPGWAYDFVRQGYTVYMMDYPGQGRSAFIPGVDGNLLPPRSGPLMEEVWSGGRPASTPANSWPQAIKYSQWPSNAPNKGKMGDPVFDYFAKTELQTVTSPNQEKRTVDAVEQLLDLIGQPVILLVNSGIAASGWVVADARSKLIKGIVAVEPVAPPIENAERGASGSGRAWGLTNLPVHYDPPVQSASELETIREDKPDGIGLIPCWVQKEPARKLVNLQSIPVLNVSGEASYHRPYAHCIAKWLNQAGVKTTFVNLEDVALGGNGHQMMSEANSAAIAKYFQTWIEKNVR
jgi:pimeloyl-ACP methyl ester carboxylesterase